MRKTIMDKWLADVVTVGGMTGTRAEHIELLQSEGGWTFDQAIKIACYWKAVQ